MPATTYTDDQLDALDALERKWEKSLPKQESMKELMTLYPTAKTAALRLTRSRILAVKKDIQNLTEVREVWGLAINKMKPKEQPGFIAWLNDHIARRTQEYEAELKKYSFELSYLKNLGREEVLPKSGVTDELIVRAKATPIASLLKVSRSKKALCLWHQEEHASMHCYETRVYCFSCAQAGDAIDVYMKLTGSNFITAVKALT